MNVKDSEIILCKGIKLDKNFENVLSYDNYDMVNLCRNNQIATSTSYSILDPTVNSIDVALPYASCIYANYIAFKNPHYGNKWFFGFVEKVKYVSNNCTTIEYKVDVFSTWYEEFNIGKAFVEREHVSDDTFGKHIINEGINRGDYVINSVTTFDEYANDIYIVAGVSKLPSEIYDDILSNSTVPTKVYNGIYSGLYYITFDSFDDVTWFLMIMDGQGIADSVYDLFIIPKSIITLGTWLTKQCSGNLQWNEWSYTITPTIKYQFITNSTYESTIKLEQEITRNSTLNGYTPKNNKMFTKEFNYMYVTNNAGQDVTYAYEDFYNNTVKFSVKGAICPGCSIRLIPKNYKLLDQSGSQDDICNQYGLTGAKYPVCSWYSDSYTNWLTQQGINKTDQFFDIISSFGGDYGSTLLSDDGDGSGDNTVNAIKKFFESNPREEKYPPQAKGNTNAGDVVYSMGWNQFVLFQMSCRYDNAKRCDDYLSRFGYKVNEIKTPNLNSRQVFNYIKVGGKDELITGDIPASDLEEINNIFRKGVTIFHNYSNFGDYTINNPIVNAPY